MTDERIGRDRELQSSVVAPAAADIAQLKAAARCPKRIGTAGGGMNVHER
jgi:hypothetical protein